jgi:hypothetical protein
MRNQSVAADRVSTLVQPKPEDEFLKLYAEAPQRVQRLQQLLRDLGAEITEYFRCYELPRGRWPNLDPLSHEFIDNMFWVVWPELRFKNCPIPWKSGPADLIGLDKHVAVVQEPVEDCGRDHRIAEHLWILQFLIGP